MVSPMMERCFSKEVISAFAGKKQSDIAGQGNIRLIMNTCFRPASQNILINCDFASAASRSASSRAVCASLKKESSSR